MLLCWCCCGLYRVGPDICCCWLLLAAVGIRVKVHNGLCFFFVFGPRGLKHARRKKKTHPAPLKGRGVRSFFGESFILGKNYINKPTKKQQTKHTENNKQIKTQTINQQTYKNTNGKRDGWTELARSTRTSFAHTFEGFARLPTTRRGLTKHPQQYSPRA